MPAQQHFFTNANHQITIADASEYIIDTSIIGSNLIGQLCEQGCRRTLTWSDRNYNTDRIESPTCRFCRAKAL